MRHQKKTVKLGRTAEHRKALLANQVCSLIEHSRIKTTLAKAKAVRPFAEKMVTLGKGGTLHNRRTAIAYLHQTDAVKKLFEEIAPASANRAGGYTRIIKLGPRLSDSAPMAFIEWVDAAAPVDGDAPKVVTIDKPAKAPKPAKADGTTTARKRGAVGSQSVAAKAKRLLEKMRKEKAEKQNAAKPKAKLKGGKPKK